MIINSTTTCSFSNPLWILKSGEIRTLEPLGTASTNANFQFGSSTCLSIFNTTSTTDVYNGFTAGETIISLLLFMILLLGFTSFIVFRFLGIKIKKGSI